MTGENRSKNIQRERTVTISVLIPCYNSESTVLESVRSFLNQTSAPMEIVVVDDGSTDRTVRLVEELRETDETAREKVRIVRMAENRGPAAVRNRAAEAARGDVLFFAESDGYYPKNAVSKVRPFFPTGDERIYLGPAYRRCWRVDPGWSLFWDSLFEARHLLILRDRWPLHSGWIFSRRRFFEENGYDETCLQGSDTEFIERLRLAGLERKIMRRSTYHHMEPQSSRGVFRRFYRAGRLSRRYRLARGKFWKDAAYAVVAILLLLPVPVNLAFIPLFLLARADMRIGWHRINLHRKRGKASLGALILYPYRYYWMKLAVSFGILRSFTIK